MDTSALLRLVLGEARGFAERRSAESLAVEPLRTIDRLRLQGALSTDDAASRRETVGEWLEAGDLVLLQRPVLARASEPLPTPLGSLAALRLFEVLGG